MGEYEATIERLNKILAENGFSKVNEGALRHDSDGSWYTDPCVAISFDCQGRYIKAKN
jgi:hypothetical protein